MDWLKSNQLIAFSIPSVVSIVSYSLLLLRIGGGMKFAMYNVKCLVAHSAGRQNVLFYCAHKRFFYSFPGRESAGRWGERREQSQKRKEKKKKKEMP